VISVLVLWWCRCRKGDMVLFSLEEAHSHYYNTVVVVVVLVVVVVVVEML